MNSTTRPILIIDDRATELDLTKHAFLRQRKLRPIVEARDGEEALSFFQRWDDGEALPVFTGAGSIQHCGIDCYRRSIESRCSANCINVRLVCEIVDAGTGVLLGHRESVAFSIVSPAMWNANDTAHDLV